MTVAERMDVLFVVPTLHGGGAERVIVTLLQHFDRARLRLFLAVIDTRHAVYLASVPDDVQLFDLKCSKVRYAIPRLLQLIWQLKPRIVMSTIGHLNLALALVRPLLPRKCSLIARETVVVSQMLSGMRHSTLWHAAYQWLYPWLDGVVCQSHDMLDDLVNRYNFPERKAVLIHNPVDVGRIGHLWQSPEVRTGYKGGFINLVSAGRLVPQKGFDILLEALAANLDQKFTLTILGEGSQKESLQKQVHRLGLQARVRLIGFQKNPYPFFRQADALVLSSRYEGFPNVVLESLACGTPVIATPAPGGVREILEGIPGCKIATSVDANSLAETLREWMHSDRRRVDPAVVLRYAPKAIAEQYAQLFSS
jgi:glycosyltransferase involved in cell wall biosynthesis